MAKLTPAQTREMIAALHQGQFLFVVGSVKNRVVDNLIELGYAAESTDPAEKRWYSTPIRPTAAGVAALIADAHAAAIRENKKRDAARQAPAVEAAPELTPAQRKRDTRATAADAMATRIAHLKPGESLVRIDLRQVDHYAVRRTDGRVVCECGKYGSAADVVAVAHQRSRKVRPAATVIHTAALVAA